MKKSLLLVFFLIPAIFYSQSLDRVEITGTVAVPSGYSSGGIHVYNKSSGKGGVSDSGGNFDLRVKEGDSIYFSALQFEEQLIIVDSEVIQRRRLVVEIREGVNELPEVVIRPHDLTGDLEIDAENIETQELILPTMSAFSINDYDWEWRPDAQTGVTNAAMGGNFGKYGFKPKKILGGLVDLLTPASGSRMEDSYKKKAGYDLLEQELMKRYEPEFFKEVLDINRENLLAYIAFLSEQGVATVLLEEENELQLLDLMVKQSAIFRQR